MEDAQIIDLFFARDQQAIGELDSKYGGVCRQLSCQILNSRLDAEECVNDAYLGVWNAIPPARPNPLLTFLCRIVRNLSIKRYHANTAIKRNSVYDVALSEVEQEVTAPDSAESALEAKALARLIETFWKSMKVELGKLDLLNEQTYRMVVEYYVYYYNHLRPHSSLNYHAPLSA